MLRILRCRAKWGNFPSATLVLSKLITLVPLKMSFGFFECMFFNVFLRLGKVANDNSDQGIETFRLVGPRMRERLRQFTSQGQGLSTRLNKFSKKECLKVVNFDPIVLKVLRTSASRGSLLLNPKSD